MSVTIPEKVNPPTDGVWHWKHCYFHVGDPISWRNWTDIEPRAGKVTNVKANRMGRISYFCGDSFILIEDVSRVGREDGTSRTRP